MATLCPACRATFPDEDVNVAKDVAYCRACDKAYTLSDLAAGVVVGEADLNAPPKGAWYRDDGLAVSLGCSTRSAGAGCFLVFFAAFWNGITWVILVAMLTGSANVKGPGITHSGGTTTVGVVAYVFMTPFLLIGLATAAGAVAVLFGRVELTIRGNDALLFRGVGGVGHRRRFEVSGVTGVSIRPSSWKQNNRPVHQVCIDGPGVTFGASLNEAQRQFMAAALKKVAGV